MADQKPAAFESKLDRLEAIVKELEGGNVDLDRAIALFNEGKTLARDCESLLKVAQEQIDRAMQGNGENTSPERTDDLDDEIPF